MTALEFWYSPDADGVSYESDGTRVTVPTDPALVIERIGTGPIGIVLGSATRIAYYARLPDGDGRVLTIISVLTSTGDVIAPARYSEPIDVQEASALLEFCAATPNPVSTLRGLIPFSTDPYSTEQVVAAVQA